MSEQSDIISWVSMCVSIITIMIALINHKRITSTCLNKKLEASLDINSTYESSSITPIPSSD